MPATLTLHDVSRDGRVLLSRDAWGASISARAPGSDRERDLSWLDDTMAWDISEDGTTVVLEESWEGSEEPRGRSTCARLMVRRRFDSGKASRWRCHLTSVWSCRLRSVRIDSLCCQPASASRESCPEERSTRTLPKPSGCLMESGSCSRLQSQVMAIASHLQSIETGDPRPVTPEKAYGRIAVLPNGKGFVTRDADRRLALFSLDDSPPRLLTGAEDPETCQSFSVATAPGCTVEASSSQPGEISRVNLRTSQREHVRTLTPSDPAGVTDILLIVMTPDAQAYTYNAGSGVVIALPR